jgi:uncharacterized protein (TIGR02265 family)
VQGYETATIEAGGASPLQLTVEMAQVLSRLGDDYTRKGFFFHRHVRTLGEDFEKVRETLEAPPKLGLYFPFQDYPTRDYMRVFHAAALKRNPQVSTAQAHRLLAREELGSYLELAVGRVTFGMFNDPMAFILAYGELSRRVMSKPIGNPVRLGDRHVQITYEDPIGSLPYALGALEGIIMAFKMHPRVTIKPTPTGTLFDLRWDL